jgi:hypothetical protein
MSFGLTISVPAKLEINRMDLEELEECCHQICCSLSTEKKNGLNITCNGIRLLQQFTYSKKL